MKGIPVWVWLLVGAGAIYFFTRSSTPGVGSQIYLPAGTPIFSDQGLTQSAGSTSIAGISTIVSQSGNATQISIGGANYWVNGAALVAPTAAQLSASNAGTLT